MEAAEVFATEPELKAEPENVPVVALASALAFAAAGGLLLWSFFPARKRRASVAGQVSLGVLAACAATVVWHNRQQEADAARQLFTHLGEVRDARWLKKHPIAYG